MPPPEDLIKLGEAALADPQTPPEARPQIEKKLAELRGTPNLGVAPAPKVPAEATTAPSRSVTGPSSAPKPASPAAAPDVHSETPEQWRARRAAAKEAPPPPPPPSRYDPPAEPFSLGGMMRSVPDYYFEPASGPDDARYQQALDQAKREGRPLVRQKDTTGLESAASSLIPYFGAAAHALSRVRTLGAADRTAGGLAGVAGERAGEAGKNIKDVATQGVDMPGMRPINIPGLGPVVPVAFLSALFGGGGKGSAMNPIGKVAGAVGSKIPGAAGSAAAGAVGAGMASAGESAVDAAANLATGQPQEQGQMQRAGVSALIGAPMGLAMRGTQALAGKGAQALRGGRRGADLVTAEQGGVSTAMFGPGGMKPTPEIRAAQAQQAETGQAAQAISREAAAKEIIQAVGQRREANISRTNAENLAYRNSPAGHETVSAQPAVDKMFEIKARNTYQQDLGEGSSISGGDIPWSEYPALKKQLSKMASGRLVDPQTAADSDYRVVSRAEAEDMGLKITGVGGPDSRVEVVPNQMSPAVLESSIRNVSNLINEGAATRNRNRATHEEIAASLRSMRDEFPATGPTGVAPASLTATTKSGKKELTGYSALKAQQGQRFDEMENVLRSVGLNKDLKQLDPAQHDQLQSVSNALSSRRMSPDEMKALIGGDKKIEKLLRTALAHKSFDTLMAGSGVHGSIIDSGGGPHAFVRGAMPSAFRADPAMRAVGNYKEPTPARQDAVAGRAAQGTTFLRQNLLDLRAALNPQQDQQGATP